MAFFDDIGKKISQAGQNAVQKTKDMTEVVKINSSISEEEKKINSIYNEIGRLYASLHEEDAEPVFADKIAAVKASEKAVADMRRQILDIKGVQTCPECGKEIPAGVAFCSGCGKPVPKQESPATEASEKKLCPGCGAEVKAGTSFCTQCGTKLN